MATSELIIEPVATSRDTLIVGAVAGLTGGAAMAFWGMLTSVYHGMGLLSFFGIVGATFMSEDAIQRGMGQVAFGLLLHLATSALLGVAFAALLPPSTSRGQAAAAGLGFGLATLLVMTFAALPVVNPAMRDVVATLPKSWLIQHALFGVALGLVPEYRRLHNEQYVRVRLPRDTAVVR